MLVDRQSIGPTADLCGIAFARHVAKRTSVGGRSSSIYNSISAPLNLSVCICHAYVAKSRSSEGDSLQHSPAYSVPAIEKPAVRHAL